MEIVEKARGLISNMLAEKEIELVDITCRREGPGMVLRLIVDKKSGVTLDECAWVNQAFGELLDKENTISERYLLEVSSPGLDRSLKTKKDFDRVKGKLVKVFTYGPIEEKREHVGSVVDCEEKCVIIELKDMRVIREIPLEKIAKARLEIEF